MLYTELSATRTMFETEIWESADQMACISTKQQVAMLMLGTKLHIVFAGTLLSSPLSYNTNVAIKIDSAEYNILCQHQLICSTTLLTSSSYRCLQIQMENVTVLFRK